MQTLTYGYQNPENGDKGSTLFGYLNANITRLNGHTHNGSDSAPLSTASTVATTQAISSAGWTASGSGYSQTVALPSGLSFDTCWIGFRITSGTDAGCTVFPTIQKVDSTHFTIYVNDNTLNLLAVYSS